LNVLVTGGAGFIGSHLVEALTAAGNAAAVRVLDNLSTGNIANLTPFLGRIEFLRGDLLEPETLSRAVRDIEVIFHEAAIPSVPRSVRDPVENHLHGAHATLLLLEAARQAKVRRVIYAASSAAYGEREELPKHEEMTPTPLSPYAAGKVAGEQYMRAYAHCYGMETVSLRYFNIFGPRQDPSSPYSGVIARFCQACLRGEAATIYGDGEQSRDFTYVANVVEANLLAARSQARLRGEALNVGCGERWTLNETLRLLGELSGAKTPPVYAPAREGDVRHSQADLTLTRRRLGYAPVVSFREGLRRTLAWYREAGADAGDQK